MTPERDTEEVELYRQAYPDLSEQELVEVVERLEEYPRIVQRIAERQVRAERAPPGPEE